MGRDSKAEKEEVKDMGTQEVHLPSSEDLRTIHEKHL